MGGMCIFNTFSLETSVNRDAVAPVCTPFLNMRNIILVGDNIVMLLS